MTHKSANAEIARPETGILRKRPELIQVNNHKMSTPPSHNGHDPFKELPEAISEKDIISLRQQLQEISASYEIDDDLPAFDLSEELDISGFLQEQHLPVKENPAARKPLPRIHLHNHRRAEKENNHKFYLEQLAEFSEKEEAVTDPVADADFPFLEEALQENDVMELREILHQIGKAESFTSFSAEEIEEYLQGNLSQDESETFEAELDVNPGLKEDLALYAEVDKAISESDVMDLQDQLGRVFRSQHSTGRSIEETDAFVDDELEETLKMEIRDEMAENRDLHSEINLIRDLDNAFNEKDIDELRSKLAGISGNLDHPHSKSLILFPEKFKKLKRSRTYAAVLLALIGLSSIIWQQQRDRTPDYDSYFKMPEKAATFRTLEPSNETELSKGYAFFNQSEFENALTCFNIFLEKEPRDPVVHFYAGIAQRNLQQFPDALRHFHEVTAHRDIILVQQAEWYKVLCYLKMAMKDSSALQLEAVISRKGYYYRDALVLRAKLKDD
jgi:hypothetical protein